VLASPETVGPRNVAEPSGSRHPSDVLELSALSQTVIVILGQAKRNSGNFRELARELFSPDALLSTKTLPTPASRTSGGVQFTEWKSSYATLRLRIMPPSRVSLPIGIRSGLVVARQHYICTTLKRTAPTHWKLKGVFTARKLFRNAAGVRSASGPERTIPVGMPTCRDLFP